MRSMPGGILRKKPSPHRPKRWHNFSQAPEVIMDDIFGQGGWASLKVGNDLGVATKKSLVTALSRAYLEALVDLKMTKEWDQRDGLD